MLTIFTTCRDGNRWPLYGIMQYNALKSWTLLNPRPQIFVLGDDPSVKELCDEVGVIHLPFVETTPNGVPIIPSMIEIAESHSANNTLALVASDNILMDDTMETCQFLSSKLTTFMAVARKQDKTFTQRIDFSDPNWRQIVKEGTEWLPWYAGDWFMWNRGFWGNSMPRYAIGRARCDNWMFGYANYHKALIDVTEMVTTIHQNHEKFETTNREEGLRNDADFRENERLFAGSYCGNIDQSYWVIRNKELHRR